MLRSSMPGMSGIPSADAFLDTIPEDQSVVSQRVQNLSVASVVASSDTDDECAPGADGAGGGETSRRRHQSRGPASVTSSSHAIIDINDDGTQQEQKPTTSSTGGRTRSKFCCTTKSIICSTIGLLLIVGIIAGVFFIVKRTAHEKEERSEAQVSSPTMVPTPEFTLPPVFYFEMESNVPTLAPSINSVAKSAIDAVLLQVSSAEDLGNPNTPQGTCRHWITEKDNLQLRVSTVGEASIVQRYVLCVLYHATNGNEWSWMDATMPFLDPDVHECDWKDVACDTDNDVVASLYLTQSNLQGTIPSELIHLSGLEIINFGENRLNGTIPRGLLELPNLMLVNFSSNALTGTIPSTAASPTTPSQYSPLEVLYLDNNQLEGTVPFFDSLQRLRVQRNLFTACDPGYATLGSLTSWTMYNNSIKGPLPEFWDAPNLTHVDLALNQWTGTIPESLWNLPMLEALVLHNALLTGTLPASTISTHWRHLWLHSNQLSGTIPLTFASDWSNVTHILLHENELTGTISIESCSHWPLKERVEADCKLANLTCACCTVCHP